MPKLYNLKINELRKHGYKSVEDWLSKPGHMYIGREMKVFIYTDTYTNELPGTKVGYNYNTNSKYLIRLNRNKSKKYCQKLLSCDVGSYVNNHQKIVKRYHISQSKWHNPYRVNKIEKNGLSDSLNSFTNYFHNNKELLNSLHELDHVKAIGCWCTPKPCHGNVILNAYYKQRTQRNQNIVNRNNTNLNHNNIQSVWGLPSSSTNYTNNTIKNYFQPISKNFNNNSITHTNTNTTNKKLNNDSNPTYYRPQGVWAKKLRKN